jgi:hypothetical protein
LTSSSTTRTLMRVRVELKDESEMRAAGVS